MGRYPDRIWDFAVDLLIAAVELLEYAQKNEKSKIKQLIMEIANGGACVGYERELSFSQCRKVKKAAKEQDCGAPKKHDRVFSHIDRIVHKREEWAFSAAMNSERIAGYESINGLNRYGWYHGDGMTQLMLKSDLEQYGRRYWERIDPYRIPGTTVDRQERYPVSISLKNDYLSEEVFAGGVCIRDEMLAAAMRLRSFHCETGVYPPDVENMNTEKPYHKCSLSAKKAWFVFDEAVVALGCDICANDGFEVETIVENRCVPFENEISAEGMNNIRLDEKGAETDLSGKRWINWGGAAGYVFPEGGMIKLARNQNHPEFAALWIEHGKNPRNGSYAYIILPNATATETKKYAETSDIEILSNTPAVQCVRQKASAVKVFVFYQAGRFDEVGVSHPALVLMKRKKNGFKIFAVDPTHKLDNLQISLKGKWKLLHEYAGAVSEYKCGNTIISLDMAGTEGESVEFAIDWA